MTALFELQEDCVRFSNGVERRLERIEQRFGACVMVVAWIEDRVILVREYGAGSRQYELGFPTGTLAPGETPEETAGRELREEVGRGARRFSSLGVLKSLPGQLDHATHLVLAQDLYPATLPGDEPEPVQVLTATLAEVRALIEAGQLREARSVAAGLLAERTLGL